MALGKDIQSMDWELQRPELIRQAGETDFIDMAIGGLDGRTQTIEETEIELGDREYVKNALADAPGSMDVAFNRATNELNLLNAVPIKRGGRIVGFLNGRSDGNALSDIVEGTGFGESGYGYLINGEATVIAHPDRNLVVDQYNALEMVKEDDNLKSLAELTEIIMEERSGVGEYSYNGNELYAGYAPIQGTDWILIIVANKDEVLGSIPTMRNSVMGLVFIVLIISIGVSYIIGHLIAKPIIVVTQYSATLADYDITQDLPKSLLRRKDEIGGLGRSLQGVTDNLRYIVTEIRDDAEHLAATSQEMSATTEQLALGAEEVSKTAEEIANGATNQAQNTQAGSQRAAVLGDQIIKDSGYMENLNVASGEVIGVIKEGLVDMEKLTNITEESNHASKEVHDVILKTNNSSIRIAEASNLIASIAE